MMTHASPPTSHFRLAPHANVSFVVLPEDDVEDVDEDDEEVDVVLDPLLVDPDVDVDVEPLDDEVDWLEPDEPDEPDDAEPPSAPPEQATTTERKTKTAASRGMRSS